jgi:hypothetical protein
VKRSYQLSAISGQLKAEKAKAHERFCEPKSYENLSRETIEVKQMLTSFIKKLKADR